jgi:hypothetical protein
MSPTCRQHVGDVSKCRQFWPNMRVGSNTKTPPTQNLCRGTADTVPYTKKLHTHKRNCRHPTYTPTTPTTPTLLLHCSSPLSCRCHTHAATAACPQQQWQDGHGSGRRAGTWLLSSLSSLSSVVPDRHSLTPPFVVDGGWRTADRGRWTVDSGVIRLYSLRCPPSAVHRPPPATSAMAPNRSRQCGPLLARN